MKYLAIEIVCLATLYSWWYEPNIDLVFHVKEFLIFMSNSWSIVFAFFITLFVYPVKELIKISSPSDFAKRTLSVSLIFATIAFIVAYLLSFFQSV